VRNVSVLGGFSLADVPDCGVVVCVTADDGHDDVAAAVAAEVADLAWSLRPRYRIRATPLTDAVAIARAAATGATAPVLLADVADNPGGGAPGTSTAVLGALLDAGVTGVVAGLQCDRAVVDAAWAAGIGGRLTVTFNAGSTDPLAVPLAVDATVTALVDAPLVPTVGVYAGAARPTGRCCALDIGGVAVGVSSHPAQCADPDTLRHVGLEPSRAAVTVVKSRGHFRAGFAHLFADEQVVEVDAPGVAAVDLAGLTWQHLPRPVFPLDDIATWTPDVVLHHHRPVQRQGQPA
jgi:microcystin degradation protein MlrC